MGRAPQLCCRPSLEGPELSCSTNKTAGHDGHWACTAELSLEQDGEDAHEGLLPGSQQLPKPMAGGSRPCSPSAPHAASEGTDLAGAPQLPPAGPGAGQRFTPTAGAALLRAASPSHGPRQAAARRTLHWDREPGQGGTMPARCGSSCRQSQGRNHTFVFSM